MLETDFAAEAKDKGLVLGIDKADYWVRSEALLLDRILRNLLTNAIRYTESGRVSLRLERVDESAVRITVSDTGRGIPADKQEKIFQEFYRNGAKMEKGLGLGLAIAQQMAKLLESQVLIHSVVGKGSDFSIKVPEGIPDAKDIDVTLKQTSPANATLLTDQLVIVLDDDPQILKATAGLLERWGCLVISAGNKGAILADLKVQNRQPLAYIVDYQLDDSETGIDVLCNLLEGDLTSRGIIQEILILLLNSGQKKRALASFRSRCDPPNSRHIFVILPEKYELQCVVESFLGSCYLTDFLSLGDYRGYSDLII
jgi:CheY-like chemotaxis protein